MTYIPEPNHTTSSDSENISGRTRSGQARWAGKTPEERKAHMKKAADARWAKNRATETQPVIAPTREPADKRTRKRSGGRKAVKGGRVYSVALVAAEKQLAKAIEEMAKAAKLYAVNAALIEPFTRTINALRAQQNPAPQPKIAPFQPNSGPVTYGLPQIMSDAPLPLIKPPLPPVEAFAAPLPQVNPRAGGGALDMTLTQPESDENAFLNDPSNPVTGGGNWS